MDQFRANQILDIGMQKFPSLLGVDWKLLSYEPGECQYDFQVGWEPDEFLTFRFEENLSSEDEEQLKAFVKHQCPSSLFMIPEDLPPESIPSLLSAKELRSYLGERWGDRYLLTTLAAAFFIKNPDIAMELGVPLTKEELNAERV